MFEEFLVILGILEPLGQGFNPFGGIDGKGVFGAGAIAVGPVCGHPGFGHVMHLTGADLHLDAFAIAPRHGGVDRAVTVGFGLADIIFEAARHGAPALVDHAQHAVAIGLGRGDDAKAVDVGQAREGEVFFLHLAPDRMGFFRTPEHLGHDGRAFKFGADVIGDFVDHIAAVALQADKAAQDRAAGLGVEDAKGQIFKLFAHGLHAHPAGQRTEDIHRFARLLGLFLGTHGADGAHIVQPVGQLDEDDTQILRHGHEEFAEILGLFGLG